MIFLRETDGLTSARHRVHNHEQSAEKNGKIEPPTKNRGENNRRRVDGNPRCQSALKEKKRSTQQTRFRIEARAEIFIGRVDIESPIDRQKHDRDEDERKRHSEIVLHKAQPVFVALPGR